MKLKKAQPISLDLFAGAGGLTEGLHQAGFRTVLANEYDEMAAHTFKHNHPDVPLLCRDIKELSVKEILKLTGVKKGDMALVCGGPP